MTDGYNSEELDLELVKPEPKDDKIRKIIEKIGLTTAAIPIAKRMVNKRWKSSLKLEIKLSALVDKSIILLLIAPLKLSWKNLYEWWWT